MTNPIMRDPEKNYAYYASNPGYKTDTARFQEARVQWIGRCLEGAKRVLDLGASDGFLAELAPRDAEYNGVELNPVAVANAFPAAKAGLKVGNVMDIASWPSGVFDRILIAETLEHVPDPEGLLRLAHGRLTDLGELVTTSANGHGEDVEPGNLEHLREWTLPEFIALHERAGYRVVRAGLANVYGLRYANCVLAVKA